jgi:hypothetical protein
MKIESPIRQLPLLVFVLIGLLYLLFVTHLSFDLFAFELKSAAYDSLAISFLRGSAEISPRAIADEAHHVNGHVYMYFGFFPALIRMPLHFLFPSLIGYWGRLSCLCAAMLAVYFFSRISKLLLESRSEILGVRNAENIHWTLCIGFACASPVIYLISSAYIYHEASLWGLVGSLCALWGMIEILSSAAKGSRTMALLKLSLGGGIALCSRGTFGIPFALLLAFYTPWFVYQSIRNRFISSSLNPLGQALGKLERRALFLPVIFFVVFQCWYDYERYGSIFDVGISRAPAAHAYYQSSIDSGPVVVAARVYSALRNYFGPPWQYIDAIFPYFHLRTPVFFGQSAYPKYTEWTISLILTIPWLLSISAAGIFALVKKGSSLDQFHVGVFAVQCYLILTFYFITQRYTADFLPMLILLASFSIRLIESPFDFKRVAFIRRVLVVLVTFSCLTSVAATISWNLKQNWAISPLERESLHALTGIPKPKLAVPLEYKSKFYPEGPPL